MRNGHEIRQDWFSFGSCMIAMQVLEPLSRERRGTVVLIEGRSRGFHDWYPLLKELASEFRCVTPELPGYGISYSLEQPGLSFAETSELFHELILKQTDLPLILVGHDTGGAVAQQIAARYSERVQALILINPALLGEDLPKLHWHHRWRAPRSRRAARKRIEKTWMQHSQTGENWTSKLKELRVPVLMLWGASSDSKYPDHFPQQLAGTFHQGTLYAQDQVSPEWVTHHVQRFLFSVLPARALFSARKSL